MVIWLNVATVYGRAKKEKEQQHFSFFVLTSQQMLENFLTTFHLKKKNINPVPKSGILTLMKAILLIICLCARARISLSPCLSLFFFLPIFLAHLQRLWVRVPTLPSRLLTLSILNPQLTLWLVSSTDLSRSVDFDSSHRQMLFRKLVISRLHVSFSVVFLSSVCSLTLT